MPIVTPVHAISRGGSTTFRVETRDDEPAFHRNVEPGATGSSSVIDFTSVFHVGHAAISAMTSQTVAGGAAIWISPSAIAGALRSMSRD
jgi:hypothetical protein